MQPFSKLQTKHWLATLDRRVSSSSVAICTSDGRVVVVKAHYKKYWSFPGGIVDKGETPLQAAVREVREETGIDISNIELRFCMVVDRVSDIAQTYQFVFEVAIDETALAAMAGDNNEIEEIALVTKQQVIAADRYYSQSTRLWAQGEYGYHEQIFGASANQSDI